MQQLTIAFTEIGDLVSFLQAERTMTAVAGARSVLAQVYTGICDEAWIGRLVEMLAGVSDKIVVAGATTFGEVEQGRALSKSNVVLLSCFESAALIPVQLPCVRGQEATAATQLAERLQQPPEPIRGMLLLATTLSMDCSELLSRLHTLAPDLSVFGGGSGDNGDHANTFVFSGAGVLPAGLTAVALCGETLAIERHSYLGWARMGKPMTITRAEGFTLNTIDDQPAFEVYRRYLGIEADARFFFNAMEFPFLVTRGDQVVARVPHAVEADGSIRFVGDLEVGERIDFGYAHVDTLIANVASTVDALRAFEPQAINVYSCGCRHFVMQTDVGLELAPFQALAPTAGFFTYGEFCSHAAHSPLLNSALVLVGMREGPRRHAADGSIKRMDATDEAVDIYGHNHVRVLSRFQHFMQAIMQDLEQANERLAHLADYDYLTGLRNRRVLESRLTEELERCRRYHRSCCVIFADIDHFKQLNDAHGHAAGDRMLKVIATLFAASARSSDLACRYGGEEFVLLLAETAMGKAREVAERLRAQAQELVVWHGRDELPSVTLSFGIASFPCRDIDSAEDMITMADRALYDAKNAGRNRVRRARLSGS